MKQFVFTAPNVTELLEVDVPAMGENDVLVKIERSSISAGTERANLIGDPSVSGASAPKVKFPRKVGYSSAGVVEAIGANVTRVKVGDRVACMDSKHAQYWVMPETKVFLLPDSVSMGAAALTYISIFPLAAVRKCKVEIGESAMVMGQGVLGQIAVQILRAAGATPIIAVDPVEKKREQALKFGADYALDPFDPDFAKTVKELTRGGVNVCIEVTGKGQGLDMALDCMAKFGRVALLGCTRNSDFTIDYYRKVHFPGISLIAADDSLMDLDLSKVEASAVDALCLRHYLQQHADAFDTVLIDFPPAFNAASTAALIAADDVIIPVKMDAFALRGMANLTRQIKNMQRINPKLRLAGLLPTMTYRGASIMASLSILQDSGLPVYPSIRRTPKVDEMTFAQDPLLISSPTSAACKDYRRLVSLYLEGGARHE